MLCWWLLVAVVCHNTVFTPHCSGGNTAATSRLGSAHTMHIGLFMTSQNHQNHTEKLKLTFIAKSAERVWKVWPVLSLIWWADGDWREGQGKNCRWEQQQQHKTVRMTEKEVAAKFHGTQYSTKAPSIQILGVARFQTPIFSQHTGWLCHRIWWLCHLFLKYWLMDPLSLVATLSPPLVWTIGGETPPMGSLP